MPPLLNKEREGRGSNDKHERELEDEQGNKEVQHFQRKTHWSSDKSSGITLTSRSQTTD